MSPLSTETRTFRVHARHLGVHRARTLQELSFEAAAVAYVEDLHELHPQAEAISIVVLEVESGHEHCFTIDLESGETAPCG
jgi:hypothetical protein